MAKKEVAKATNVPVVEKIRTVELISAELEKAIKAKDYKLVSKLSSEIAKIEAAKEAAEKDAKVKALEAMTAKVKSAIDKVIQTFINSKELDKADGVWYVNDFGEKLTSCRLMKSQPKKRGEGKGSGSYVSRPEKTADLLAQVGSHPMFADDTVVTIDKAEVTMKAGTTLKQAYDYSNNGGWRNRVRMALLKEAGLI